MAKTIHDRLVAALLARGEDTIMRIIRRYQGRKPN